MNFFSSILMPQEPATPTPPPPQPAATTAAPLFGNAPQAQDTPPTTPGKAAAAPTQAGVANRELDELHGILEDGKTLAALAAKALETSTLEETATLEHISELSARLLCRNRARTAARNYGMALLCIKVADDALESAARTLFPSYFRHTTSVGDGDAEQMWVCKLFLHALPGAPETTLCARFSLAEHADPGGGGGDAVEAAATQYDLNLQLIQVAPFVAGASRFAFSFALVDKHTADIGEFTLDDGQRARLNELRMLLGLTSGRWTSVGMLGVLLAAISSGQMDENPCFKEMQRATREAHRAELLAISGL